MEEPEVFPGVVCAGMRAQEEVTDAMLLHEDGQTEPARVNLRDGSKKGVHVLAICRGDDLWVFRRSEMPYELRSEPGLLHSLMQSAQRLDHVGAALLQRKEPVAVRIE